MPTALVRLRKSGLTKRGPSSCSSMVPVTETLSTSPAAILRAHLRSTLVTVSYTHLSSGPPHSRSPACRASAQRGGLRFGAVQRFRLLHIAAGLLHRAGPVSYTHLRFLKALDAAGDGAEMNRFYLEQLSTHPDLMGPEVWERYGSAMTDNRKALSSAVSH